MNERTIEILDQSLEYSLWAFLFVFLASLCFIALRLKARKQGLADYLRYEFIASHQGVARIMHKFSTAPTTKFGDSPRIPSPFVTRTYA